VVWSNKIIVMTLCFFQVTVSAWGMFSCVCEDGQVAGRMTGVCVETGAASCVSGRDAGFCFCCAGEDAPHTCNGTVVSPFLLSSRSDIQQTPAGQSGGIVSATGVNWYDAPCSAANPSWYIRNFLHIESATRVSTSSIVLLI